MNSRLINVVGDSATGKTLLAIEAAANFMRANPKGRVYYAETEAAFDVDYAEVLGLPLNHVIFPEDVDTVEDLFEDFERVIKDSEDGEPTLYILDSLDGLTDRAEMARRIDEGSFDLNKQKKLGQLFRRLVRKLKKSEVTILVVSQVRAKIGVVFGKKLTRSGGKALDFYSSQIVWLAHLKRVEKTRKKVKRAIGVRVRAKVEKNRNGPPFREAEFPILFTFGIEDVIAGVEWLKSASQLKRIGMTETSAGKTLNRLEKIDAEEYAELRTKVIDAVFDAWAEIELEFTPKRRKYG